MATTRHNFDFSGDTPRDPDELETALARIAAHEAFDPLWHHGPWSRSRAYKWLSEVLGIPPEKTHIKLFDAPTCRRVVALAEQQRLAM